MKKPELNSVPNAGDFAEVERDHPNETRANKYNLAVAAALIRWYKSEKGKLKKLPSMPGKTKAEREYNLAIHGKETP